MCDFCPRPFVVVFPPHDSQARGESGFWRLLAVNPKTDLFSSSQLWLIFFRRGRAVSDFGSMVSQEVPGVWRQRVVCGGRIKKIKKKNGQTRSTKTESFGHRPAGVSMTWQHRYKGVAKNASAMASVLFVAFCRGLMKEPREKTMEKSCVAIRRKCNRKLHQQCAENGGCLVLLRCL